MNTNHMKYFVDAATFGSLQKSAAINHVTHSAISLSIRTLEKELGADLLVHEKRKFALTREGELVKVRFEAWLRELEDFQSVRRVVPKRRFPRSAVHICRVKVGETNNDSRGSVLESP